VSVTASVTQVAVVAGILAPVFPRQLCILAAHRHSPTWRSREIWYVQNVDSRKILTVTVLEKKVSAMIALECK
jgi:hypothetical protein